MKVVMILWLSFLAYLGFATELSFNVKVPTKTMKKAYWADVNGNTTVKAQWES